MSIHHAGPRDLTTAKEGDVFLLGSRMSRWATTCHHAGSPDPKDHRKIRVRKVTALNLIVNIDGSRAATRISRRTGISSNGAWCLIPTDEPEDRALLGPRVSRDAKELMVACTACDGYEVPREYWPYAEELVDVGLAIWASVARGPGGNFRRLVPAED